MKIEIEKEDVAEIWHEQYGLIGEVSIAQFNAFRVKIKELEATGYSVKFNGCDYPIETSGKVRNWPRGLFDKFDADLREIIGF